MGIRRGVLLAFPDRQSFGPRHSNPGPGRAS
jgi:hypothetical protein